MSSNPAFDVDNFDDLIAAVDSIEIPIDDSSAAEPPVLTVEEYAAPQPFVADITFEEPDAPANAQSSKFNDAELAKQLDEINTLSSSDESPADLPLLFRKNSQPKAFATSIAANPVQAALVSPVNEADNANELPDPLALVDEAPMQQTTATPVENTAKAVAEEFTLQDHTMEQPDSVAAQDDFSQAFDELDSLPLTSEADVSLETNVEPVFAEQSPAPNPFLADVSFEQPGETVDTFSEAFDDIDSLPLTDEPMAAALAESDQLLDGFSGMEESVDFSMKVCATAKTDSTQSSHVNNVAFNAASNKTANEASPQPASSNNTDNRAAEETIVLSQHQKTTVDAYLKKPSYKKPGTRGILYNLSQRFSSIYVAMTSIVALLGFAYVLMIPALFAVSVFNAFEMLSNPFTSNTLTLTLAFFSISLFLFLVGYKLFDLKFLTPEGITLDENNAEQLLQTLQQLKQEQRIPKIHQIVLTRRHELNVIKVPRLGFPVWSKNVLAIGYPLLQTMTPDYFDAALSRRLIQFSKRRNVLINWLSFMRRTWTLYAESLKQRNGVIDLLHYCFFAPYASLYRNFAVYITQKDELLADEMALESCNDWDLVKGAQTIRITQAMLIQYFWPKLDDAIRNHMSAPAHIRPYYNLPKTLANLLDSEDVNTWFIRLAQELKNPGSPEAPFAIRMARMGHRKVSVPKSFDLSAARHYFGDEYDTMTDHMDELWAKEVQEALFLENLKQQQDGVMLPFRLSIEPA